MKSTVSKAQVRKLIGKPIYAVKKDGAKVSGILRGIRGNELILELPKNKKVKTKAIIPLVLFDLLAVGTYSGGYGGYSPYGYGGYGYGGYGGGFY
jgi:hypothetical protein